MSDHERGIDISGLNDGRVNDQDEVRRARDGRAEASSEDDERRAAAADSRNDLPRINIDDIDASARGWGGQEYGEVM